MAKNRKGRKTVQNGQLTAQQQELLKRLEAYVKRKKKGRKINLPICILLAAIVLVIVWFFLIRPLIRKPSPVLTDDLLSVHFIDVGQGDSAFVEADGVTMLIDCGEAESADKVIGYLKDLGVKKLNYVVATHPHSDHMGGMYRIIDEFDIGEAIIPHLPDEDIPTTRFFEKFLDSCEEKDVRLTEAGTGRLLYLGDAKVEIIAPCGEKYSGLNDYSVGLFISHGENSFLLTGDAEKKSESEMLDSGRLRHADVYKAGHHGSNTSSSDKFLKEVAPDYAVISCGAGNSYGHPNDSTMKRLAAYTDKIYRTDLCGTVVFESDGDKLTVRTERE